MFMTPEQVKQNGPYEIALSPMGEAGVLEPKSIHWNTSSVLSSVHQTHIWFQGKLRQTLIDKYLRLDFYLHIKIPEYDKLDEDPLYGIIIIIKQCFTSCPLCLGRVNSSSNVSSLLQMSNLSVQPLKSISDVSGELEQIACLNCIKFELGRKRLAFHTLSVRRK